jgi:hypothetical protein
MSSLRRMATFLFAAVVITLTLASAASASQFYLEKELPTENEPIKETQTATLASNGLISVSILTFKISCHFEGAEKLFTGGKDEVTELKLTLCAVTGHPTCVVTATTVPKEKPNFKSQATEFGSPIKYGDLTKSIEINYVVTGCALEAIFKLTGNLEGEADNTVILELVFPSTPLSGSTTKIGSTAAVVEGRLRVMPTVGRRLSIGA